jgi:hypothetical protein
MKKHFKNGNRTHEMFEHGNRTPKKMFKSGNRTHDMFLQFKWESNP